MKQNKLTKSSSSVLLISNTRNKKCRGEYPQARKASGIVHGKWSPLWEMEYRIKSSWKINTVFAQTWEAEFEPVHETDSLLKTLYFSSLNGWYLSNKYLDIYTLDLLSIKPISVIQQFQTFSLIFKGFLWFCLKHVKISHPTSEMP